MSIRSEQLSQALCEDDLVVAHNFTVITVWQASEIAAGKRRSSCVLEGRDENGCKDDELRIEEDKEGEEKGDETCPNRS